MGTSTNYAAPPSWGPLKREITRAAVAGSPGRARARQALQDYIRQSGGARAMARTSSSVGTGKGARSIAGRLGTFISDVAARGLDVSLRNVGLSGLVGKPVSEVLAGILNHIGGPASTIDEVDARTALARLREKTMDSAANTEDLEKLLSAQAGQLEAMLRDFFGFYLFEQFCRVFFERLVQRVGETKALSFIQEIEDFVNSALANRMVGRNLIAIRWDSGEGRAILAEIMESAFKVFGE